MAEPHEIEDLLVVAERAFAAQPYYSNEEVALEVEVFDDEARVVDTLDGEHLISVIRCADPRAALHAAIMAVDGREHAALRTELAETKARLAAADLALVTAQNDLDHAGQELAKRSAERDQARADAERLREQVAPLADQVTCFNGLLEAEIGQLVREGQSDVGARLRKVLTRVATIGLKKPEGGAP